MRQEGADRLSIRAVSGDRRSLCPFLSLLLRRNPDDPGSDQNAAAELRRRQEEAALRRSILDRCAEHGFQCRFLYQSVIITTPLSDWCFDYHTPKKTLYHESTTKINLVTGDYAKAHVQFRDRHMSPIEVIDYIADHDSWKAAQTKK